MEFILFAPPVVFAIFILLLLLFSRKLSEYSAHNEEKHICDDIEGNAYACGQQNVKHYVNPDYSQFFPYAFFFTILHVLVLVVVTAPKESAILSIAYIVAGALAMFVLFKKDES
ncbi:MAG TPA: hypothetical protein GXZ61_02800 [Clostridiales bacterium]|jgi:NADH:ubiquinone oxidoreductase subunit 3 (subunit A)|nr:hypothetical protein [Clostridiales bacterium]